MAWIYSSFSIGVLLLFAALVMTSRGEGLPACCATMNDDSISTVDCSCKECGTCDGYDPDPYPSSPSSQQIQNEVWQTLNSHGIYNRPSTSYYRPTTSYYRPSNSYYRPTNYYYTKGKPYYSRPTYYSRPVTYYRPYYRG